MGAFSDGALFRFTQDSFVADWLTNQAGLQMLFSQVYRGESVEVRELEIGAVRRQFQVPAWETLQYHGVDERIVPSTERTRHDGRWPRRGRLEWIDIFLEVTIAAKVASLAAPIERITSHDLSQKLGDIASIADLKAALANLYSPSIVDAFFERFRIESIEDFREQPMLFLEFVYKAPPLFDPNSPASSQTYPLNVCVLIRETFAAREALQSAKICRLILEKEQDHHTSVAGATVITPYAFVVVFPGASVVDGTISGMDATKVKASALTLFQAENMFCLFA